MIFLSASNRGLSGSNSRTMRGGISDARDLDPFRRPSSPVLAASKIYEKWNTGFILPHQCKINSVSVQNNFCSHIQESCKVAFTPPSDEDLSPGPR